LNGAGCSTKKNTQDTGELSNSPAGGTQRIMNPQRWTIKIYNQDKLIARKEYHTLTGASKLSNKIKWDKDTRVYLRVFYGKHLTNENKMAGFFNDGDYTNKEDYKLALDAFSEKS